jgi:hypothetical protein
MTRHAVVASIAVISALAGAAVANAAPSFVITADTKIGAFAVKADGSLAGAIRAFGQPRLRRTGEACAATWAPHGLTMSFYNLGGANPCTPSFGRFSRAVMHGTRWRTDKGVRVGMSSQVIRRHYPRATFHRGLRFYWPSGWWLVTRRELFGGGGTYPGLLAETARGTVISFRVRYPAGGD